MPRVLYFFIALLFAAGIFGFMLQYTMNPDKVLPINQIAADNWIEYKSPDGLFTVSLPREPQTAEQSVYLKEDRENRKYHLYVTTDAQGREFLISVAKIIPVGSPRPAREILGEAINGMVSANPNNVLKSDEDGTFFGGAARDFVLETPKGQLEGKVFLVDQILFTLSVLSPKGVPNRGDYHQFVQSFQLSPDTINPF